MLHVAVNALDVLLVAQAAFVAPFFLEKATVGVCPSPYDETVEEDEERGGDHRDADDDDNADDADVPCPADRTRYVKEDSPVAFVRGLFYTLWFRK